jgi:hypothetical protein
VWVLAAPTTAASVRGVLRRLAAWIVTGPIGHLYAGMADWLALGCRYVWARARGRDPWEESARAYERSRSREPRVRRG